MKPTDGASAPSSPAPPPRIGRYAIEGEIARGGMGVVYRALAEDEGQPVAIKVMLEERSSEDDHRFRLEARATARMRHPNLVSTLEFGYHEARPYLVMELVSGETLGERLLRTGPFPVGEVIRIGADLAAGLAHAHGGGVLHRDLKPENVLIDDAGVVRITDFGLAKLTSAATQSLAGSQANPTLEGQLVGTPQFMSPEQVDGETQRYDARSDVYGLGATLYTLLVGTPPFASAEKLIHLLNAIARKAPQDPRELRPELPAGLVEVVLRCLAKDPADRFESAQDVADTLDTLDAKGERPRERDPSSWTGLGLGLGLGLVAIAALVFGGLSAPTSPSSSPSTSPENLPAPDPIAWRANAGLRNVEALAAHGSKVLVRGQAEGGERRWAIADASDGASVELQGLVGELVPSWDPNTKHFVGAGLDSEVLVWKGSGPAALLGHTAGSPKTIWAGEGLCVVGEAEGLVYALKSGSTSPLWQHTLAGRVESAPHPLDLDHDGRSDHLLLGTCAGEVLLVRLSDGARIAETLAAGPLAASAFASFGTGPDASPRVLVSSRSGSLQVLRATPEGLSQEALVLYTAPFCTAPQVMHGELGAPLRVVAGTALGLVSFRPDLSVEWVAGPQGSALPRGGVAFVDVDSDGAREIAVSLCSHEPTPSTKVAIYDVQGRLRSVLNLGRRTAWLLAGALPRLIAHNRVDVFAWRSLPALPPAPKSTRERLVLSVLGGAQAAARGHARRLPQDEEVQAWDALAAWHLGERAPFEALYLAEPEALDQIFEEALAALPTTEAQRTLLHEARRTADSVEIPPVLVPETQVGSDAFRGADFETVPYRVNGVQLRTQAERGGGLFGGNSWVEVEFVLPKPEALSLVFHHQAYLDFGLAWSDLTITLDGRACVPHWCGSEGGTVDRIALGTLKAGTHRIRFLSTARSLTLWRLYYVRLEPAR